MTTPDSDGDTERRWTRQYAVAVGIVIAFSVLMVAMLLMGKGDELLWQRRLYIFSAGEALTFTAVGWLFGREVNRSALVSARQDAQQAREEAAQARSNADRVAADAAQTQVEAAEDRAKSAAVLAAVESTTPAPRRSGPSDASGGGSNRSDPQVDLKAFVERLYGRGGSG